MSPGARESYCVPDPCGSKAFMAEVRVVTGSSFPPKALKALLEFRFNTQYNIINMA